MDNIDRPQVEPPPAWFSTLDASIATMTGAITKISEDMKNANKTGGVTKQLTDGTAVSSTSMLNNRQGIVTSAVEATVRTSTNTMKIMPQQDTNQQESDGRDRDLTLVSKARQFHLYKPAKFFEKSEEVMRCPNALCGVKYSSLKEKAEAEIHALSNAYSEAVEYANRVVGFHNEMREVMDKKDDMRRNQHELNCSAMQQWSKDNAKLRTEFSVFKSTQSGEMEKKDAKIAELEKRVTELSENNCIAKGLEITCESLRSKLSEKESMISSLKADMAMSQGNFNELSKEMTEVKDEIIRKDCLIKDLKTAVEQKEVALEEATHTISKLSSELQTLPNRVPAVISSGPSFCDSSEEKNASPSSVAEQECVEAAKAAKGPQRWRSRRGDKKNRAPKQGAQPESSVAKQAGGKKPEWAKSKSPQVCFHFVFGRCHFGKGCWYPHNDERARALLCTSSKLHYKKMEGSPESSPPQLGAAQNVSVDEPVQAHGSAVPAAKAEAERQQGHATAAITSGGVQETPVKSEASNNCVRRKPEEARKRGGAGPGAAPKARALDQASEAQVRSGGGVGVARSHSASAGRASAGVAGQPAASPPDGASKPDNSVPQEERAGEQLKAAAVSDNLAVGGEAFLRQ